MTGKEFFDLLYMVPGGNYPVLLSISPEGAAAEKARIIQDFDSGISFVPRTEYSVSAAALLFPRMRSDDYDIDAEVAGADKELLYGIQKWCIPAYHRSLPRVAALRIAQGGFLTSYYSQASWSVSMRITPFAGYSVAWKDFENDWNKHNPDQAPISGVFYIEDKTLVELRKERRMTQKQVAEALGVTQKDISRWETGSVRPGPEYIAALATAYGTSAVDISMRLP